MVGFQWFATCDVSDLLTGSPAAVVDSLVSRLSGGIQWEVATLSHVLHDENAKTSLKQKEYMTILRHALTGMKVRRRPTLALVVY